MSTPPEYGERPEDELVPPPYDPAAATPAPEQTETHLLRRSTTDKVIAGVAGGLGRYLGIDPVILRIAFVVLALTGSGILIYLIGWIAIPEERPGDNIVAARPSSANTTRMLIGGLLILIGGAVLLDRLIPNLSKFFWPAAVILVGAVVLFGGSIGRRS